MVRENQEDLYDDDNDDNNSNLFEIKKLTHLLIMCAHRFNLMNTLLLVNMKPLLIA